MGDIPTRDEILKFIAEHEGETTKRDIAKAFNIKGADRISLKRLLREMAAEGLLEGSRKGGMRGQGDLPSVSVVQVTGRNKEGYLVARARREGDLLDGPQDPIIEIDDSPPRNRRHRPSPPVSRATPHWHGCGASIRTNILPASFANWAMPVGKLSAWCASAVMAYGSFRLTAANAMIINWKKTLKRRMAICWSAKNCPARAWRPSARG